MSVKITTGTVRFSYLNVFKPRAINDGKEKYSATLLLPKSDKAGVQKVKKAIEEAKKQGAAEKWKGKVPANLWNPLRDGDVEKADEHPEYAGMYFINAKSDNRPILFDQMKEEILDPTEIYSGCWGRANISLYAFDTNGNRGIGVGLNALMKKRDDEPFGNMVTADSARRDFDDDDYDDDDDDDMLG